jgi:hypothetical protein
MNHSLPSANRTTRHIPATIAWSATETDAYSEAPFSDSAFCLQLIVLSGERHVYRLKRESLAQLFGRISDLLAESLNSAKDMHQQSLPRL